MNKVISDKKEFKNENRLAKKEKIFDILMTIGLVIFAISIAPKNFQNDTFYTIKCGEYIFNNGIFNLHSDPFSWLDLPYCFPHWLYDLMIYVIYAKFGFDGIYISTILFTAILGLTLYDLCLYKSQNRLVSGVIVVLSLFLIEPYIAARAQLVTFILFVLEILFIERLLETRKIRYGVGLVVIAALIAQLHVAVFPMFFILALPYIGEAFFAYFFEDVYFAIFYDVPKSIFIILSRLSKTEENKKRYKEKSLRISQNQKIKEIQHQKIQENPYKIKVQKNKNIVILLIVLLIAFGTGLLNPTGKTAYTYLLKTAVGNTTQSINEHQPLVLATSENFAISFVMFLAILIFIDIKIQLSDVFMLIGLTTLAFLSRRQISIYALGCTPIMVKLISDFFAKYDSQTCNKILDKVTSFIGIILVFNFFVFNAASFYEEKLNEQYIYNSDYPIEACDWMLENLDVENMRIYNEYNYGSYLIFRGIPVFIDSRADLYAPEFNNKEGYANAGEDIFSIALDIPALSEDYKKNFDKYGVTHVILYSNAKLALLLDEDENYNLLYDDKAFKVYERLNVTDGE